MDLLIFGAQGYALGAYNAFKTLYPKRLVPCFVVTKMGNNAETLGGIPVKELGTVSDSMSVDEKRNTSILIATPENVQPEIEETLELYGFHNHIRFTSERWDELMKLYHVKLGQFQPLSALPVGCSSPFIRIFMAKSHVDRPLRQSITLPDYVFPIQVGRENADSRIADIVDNTGDNISDRNGNYSELTGLYWLWKNKLCSSPLCPSPEPVEAYEGDKKSSREAYYGFGQYRRMLEFSQDDLLRLIDNNVDVVLPYPMPYEPNIHAHHERYIQPSDWNALLQLLEELEPEYAEVFPEVLLQPFLYNYNVILAKKSVLRDYCSWLFPILQRTEELTDGKNRSERYIGYMAETLETLYFMRNSDRLKYGGENGKNGKNGALNIVHTLCRLYV